MLEALVCAWFEAEFMAENVVLFALSIKVFFTADIEVWCDGWEDLDEKFPSCFERYVYGHTATGDYGIPYQVKLLNDYGLNGVFFVEPLFATRFGVDRLADIVGLIRDAGQAVELHVHPEWVDEATTPLLSSVSCKRPHLRDFTLEDQQALIAAGIDLLQRAGAGRPTVFRAGNFGFNRDTLKALVANGIRFDSSYNATSLGPDCGVTSGKPMVIPFECEGVYEYPMTVFKDGTGVLRHVQISACSYAEIESLLWQALETDRACFILLFHNFELLNRTGNRPDAVAVKRFNQLCAFLDRNRDCFETRSFSDLTPECALEQPEPLVGTVWNTGARMLEQIYRRTYG